MAVDPDEVAAQAELDQLLGDKDTELEARFRELEGGVGAPSAGQATDPLADLKAKVGGSAERESVAVRFLVAVCPGCSAKNRVPLSRMPDDVPKCGRCSEDLVRERRT